MFSRKKHSKAVGLDKLTSDRGYREHIQALFDSQLHTPEHKPINLPQPSEIFAELASMESILWVYKYFKKFPDHINRLISPT